MKLTNTACKNAKPAAKARKLADGNGLYLEISPTGSKYWRMKYRFLGKENRLAFGVYPEVSLQEAREKCRVARKKLAEGNDPSQQKKLEKLEHQTNHENSFEKIAREWHSQKIHTWKPLHAENIMKRLETNIFPHIGCRPVRDVTPPELLNAVRTLEADGKRDLAHRMLQHCGQIFRYAVATGRADFDITPNLKGALQPVRSKNYAHLSEEELPEFLSKLENYDTEYNGNVLMSQDVTLSFGQVLQWTRNRLGLTQNELTEEVYHSTGVRFKAGAHFSGNSHSAN